MPRPSLLSVAWILTGGLLACSSTATAPEGAGDAGASAATDAATADQGAPSGDASTGGDSPAGDAPSADASWDAPGAPGDGGGVSVGACASCTATQCLNELQACGGSQACLAALMAFNDCVGQTPGGSCGATFGGSSAPAAALWACMSGKCAATCGSMM